MYFNNFITEFSLLLFCAYFSTFYWSVTSIRKSIQLEILQLNELSQRNFIAEIKSEVFSGIMKPHKGALYTTFCISLINNTIILASLYSSLSHMPHMRPLVSHNSTIFIIYPKSCHLSWSKLQILWSQSSPFLTWFSQYSPNWTFCSFFPFRAYSQHSLKNEPFRILALSCHSLLKAFQDTLYQDKIQNPFKYWLPQLSDLMPGGFLYSVILAS